MARLSLAVIGTRVDAARSASASLLFIRIGSSNQNGSNSSSAAQIRLAVGRFHSECSSTMMSIRLPTALRILRNGSSARFRSGPEI